MADLAQERDLKQMFRPLDGGAERRRSRMTAPTAMEVGLSRYDGDDVDGRLDVQWP
nr:hypothetical protein Itr_chr11CG00450 [Ipomoea trifida]